MRCAFDQMRCACVQLCKPNPNPNLLQLPNTAQFVKSCELKNRSAAQRIWSSKQFTKCSLY